MLDSVVFTDDEVVTLTLLYRKAWPAPVPTVDLADTGSVQAAIGRGRRSLVARGFMRETSEGAMLRADVEEVVEATLEGSPEVIVTVVDDALAAVPNGLWMSAVGAGTGDEWLRVAVGAEGMHVVERTRSEDARELVAGLVVEAVTEGVEGDEGRDVFLSVSRQRDADFRTLLARRGEAGIVGEPGLYPSPAEGTVRGLLDAFWASAG